MGYQLNFEYYGSEANENSNRVSQTILKYYSYPGYISYSPYPPGVLSQALTIPNISLFYPFTGITYASPSPTLWIPTNGYLNDFSLSFINNNSLFGYMSQLPDYRQYFFWSHGFY